jgi:MoaA/NifB/PqqE/SkfB family radical SAM enzyme
MKRFIKKMLLLWIRDRKGRVRRFFSFMSHIWPHSVVKIFERIFREVDPRFRESLMKNIFFRHMDKKQNAFPSVIFIGLTNRCNLKCEGCYIYREKPCDLPRDRADRLIREAQAEGTELFILMGGEPLLWQDLPGFLQAHPDAFFQIMTNGTLIDEELADALARTGNCSVYFSVEGMERATDRRRGSGTFQKVCRSMQLIHERGIPLGASIMVTPENFNIVTSPSFVKFLIGQGVILMFFLPFKPIGSCPDFGSLLSREKRQALYQRILKIRNAYPIIALDHENDMTPQGGCVATSGIGIYINQEGRLEPCSVLHYSDKAFDDEHSLREAWEESVFLKGIRGLHNPRAGCLFSDRPQELLNLLRSAFPESYEKFPDINGLAQYLGICGCGASAASPPPKGDLFTRIGSLFFKAVRYKTR